MNEDSILVQAYHSKLKFAFCLQVVSFREPPVRKPSPVRSERAKSLLRPTIEKTSYKKAASKASVRRTASEFPLKEDKITSSVRNAATKVSVRRTATESVSREERKLPVRKATEGLKPSTVITSPAAKPQVRSRMMPESEDDDDDEEEEEEDSSALISEYEATLEETGRSM